MYEVVMSYNGQVDTLEYEIETRKEARFLAGEHRLGADYPVWYRVQKPTRYYVEPAGGAWYGAEELAPIVKGAGGINVRAARLHGWSNQPKVVTFSGFSPEERAVKEALDSSGKLTIVREKDW